jgi:hypothetical protein
MQTAKLVNSDMEFLKTIDWQNHDGVNFGMINDFMRNQFYDRILSRYVKNQRCTDIGFGTGLLSVLALKHGATHVRAFESDYNRYLLGQEIISRLNLNDKITLINERYTHDCVPTPVTFTETVNGNLWWEGLWCSLPRNDQTVFLPGEYFLEIWAVEIPESFAQGLCRSGNTNQSFAPGVDIDQAFVDVVNDLSATPSQSIDNSLSAGIVTFERQQETDWGWIPYMRAVQAGSVVAKYSVSQHTENHNNFTLTVDTKHWADKTVLIVPRAGMQQDTNRLYLDTGHWGPTESPILLHKPHAPLTINHSVRSGVISYDMDTL